LYLAGAFSILVLKASVPEWCDSWIFRRFRKIIKIAY
jgi:hypothetical protein